MKHSKKVIVLKITLRGKENVFEQIANEYIKLISLGVLEEDSKLPSCRALAIELGINPNTVEKAYSLLEEKGYIYTIPKKGAYVLSSEKKLNDNDLKNQIIAIKNSKISYEKLISVINDVYEESEEK